MVQDAWQGIGCEIGREVVTQSERCLRTYVEDSRRVEQDAAIEAGIAEGGYGRKQLHELIQNAADAMLGSPGRIEVLLDSDVLYVANEGRPMTVEGVHALMASHLSRKRGEEIGRFGLGFKSLVAVADVIEVLSRTGSFRFDRERSASRIRKAVPGAAATATMRLAVPFDPDMGRRDDPQLDSLMAWATTVIRVQVARGRQELAEDLRTFPAEFLLFSPQARSLTLTDTASDNHRVLTVAEESPGQFLLIDNGKHERRWKVARSEHRPSGRALDDAGQVSQRETVMVTWAAPLGPKPGVGSLWAYFPTSDLTTLSGIVNAPWKLSDDRRSLLEGAFNRELLTEALPALVESELENLLDPDDPCGILDFLPARGKEARSWADDVLNRPVMDRLKRAASVPDTAGALRPPGTLRIHPRNIPLEVLELWASAPSAPKGWIHHSVEPSRKKPGAERETTDRSGGERRAKAERLLSTDEQPRTATVQEWLSALVERADVGSSAVAIKIVLALRDLPEFASVRDVPVVLLETGDLAPARPGRVFLRSSPAESGYRFIHPDLADRPDVVAELASLGVRLVDRAGELRSALSVPHGRIEWSRVWQISRHCDQDQVLSLIKDELGSPSETFVHVKNRDGRFVPLSAVFLPGGIIPLSESSNPRFTIDIDHHRDDLELLERLGAITQPVSRSGMMEESWVTHYKAGIRADYIRNSTGAKPHEDKLVVDGSSPPWPLNHLPLLTGEARAAMTLSALSLTSMRPWRVRHATNASYPVKTYRDPTLWWILKHGEFRTGIGPVPVRLCMAPVADLPETVFPMADISHDTAELLGLPRDIDDLSAESWALLFERCRGWDPERRTLLYSWAAWKVGAPEGLWVEVGGTVKQCPTAEVAVARSVEDHRSLIEQRIATLLVPDESDANQLMEEWGLEDGRALLEQELAYEASGEPQVLVDTYPRLRLHDVPAAVKLQVCESIELVTVTNNGTRSRPIDSYLNEDVLLTTANDPVAILRHVSDAFQLSLGSEEIRAIVDHLRSQELERAIAAVRSTSDLHEKLALLLGVDAMTSKTPGPALDAVRADLGRDPSGEELARLVIAVFGVRVLSAFSSTLEEKGLNPPTQWVGGTATRRFVEDLGFPREYAGFVSQSKPAMQVVEGPAPLPPLHDYQQAVTDAIKKMLRGETGVARGLVSLPTGAGKTRVAVQALVEEIAEGRVRGPIVWVAQSEELCEQAVETWSFIWRALGRASVLQVSRLWSSNEVSEVGSDVQLVVATPQKLQRCKQSGAYEWLTGCRVVVVDEAHTSVAPTYTEVLTWLGLGRSRKNAKPLIGLTATPFRNTNEAETRQLAARYDKNRLDEGAFDSDPYEFLQERHILARAEQRTLSGAQVQLNAAELADIEKFKDLRGAALNRLGMDRDRNQTIVRSIEELPADWNVLVFATSVDNARVLASLLAFRGVSAVSIEANTDAAARRHYISEFKAGRLRVITNYNVLAQGFDAPAVRAVYVTRPTFSSNLYQQMIGRGLRGPKNGGSENVLIVNVEDNIAQYGEALAFTGFDHVWDRVP